MEQFHVFFLFHVEMEPVTSFPFPFLASFTCLNFSPCLCYVILACLEHLRFFHN